MTLLSPRKSVRALEGHLGIVPYDASVSLYREREREEERESARESDSESARVRERESARKSARAREREKWGERDFIRMSTDVKYQIPLSASTS